MPCVCEPYYVNDHHFVEWIAQIFHQCVYTPVQITSFCLGLASIGFWLFAQLPQIIKTYMSGNVESLSSLFILTWLVGDITNLIGCILTHQLPTQLYTAIYYCSIDVVMVSQMAYYKIKNRSKSSTIVISPSVNEQERNREEKNKLLYSWLFFVLLAIPMIVYTVTSGHLSTPQTATAFEPMQHRIGRKLLSTFNTNAKQPEICDATLPLTLAERVVGDVSAWVSGLLYFTARIPQIYLNYQRKSVEGLSLPMFVCAICGNVTYGLSILILGVHDWSLWMENTFPYILGSICTLTMSAAIITQFFIYSFMPAIQNRRRLKKANTASTNNAYENDGGYYDEEDEEETNTVTSVDDIAQERFQQQQNSQIVHHASFKNK
jgi:uncharacterized protein with PQ loop repeat